LIRPLFVLDSTICEAIRKRRLLQFHYKDEPKPRRVEPYLYGIGRRGKAQLLCWQLEGPSRTGAATGWKRFGAVNISHAEAMREVFKPRPDFQSSDPLFSSIWASVV